MTVIRQKITVIIEACIRSMRKARLNPHPGIGSKLSRKPEGFEKSLNRNESKNFLDDRRPEQTHFLRLEARNFSISSCVSGPSC